jgi:hypothetical protein
LSNGPLISLGPAGAVDRSERAGEGGGTVEERKEEEDVEGERKINA